MKERFELAIKEAVAKKDLQYFGKIDKQLAKEFGVTQKTIHNRFHSYYGCGFREHVANLLMPSKEMLCKIIINCRDCKEFDDKLELPTALRSGLFDRVFGVSTFYQAKVKAINTFPPHVRQSTQREDNVAILMSQHLGDGSYDRRRHSLRICHGHKQVDYLRFKVALILEGYPSLNRKICENVSKKDGYVSYSWRSNKLGNVYFPEDKTEAVKLLTPLGWLLWFLDDGCAVGQNLSIAMSDERLQEAAVLELKTYGIEARCSHRCIVMCGYSNDLKFDLNFIKPFDSIIPECMHYKRSNLR